MSFKANLKNQYHDLRNKALDSKLALKKEPVFIVGCGHSGTTLLLTMIGKHSSIHSVPYESNIFLPQHDFNELKEFFYEVEKEAGEKTILEKTPRHVQCLSRLFKIFPNAKVIAMIRDGRDVVSSMKKRSIGINKAINRWVKDCQHISDHQDKPGMHIIKYEDLVTTPEEVLTDIFSFLGLKAEIDTVVSTDKKIEWGFSRTLDFENLSDDEKALREKHNKRRNEQINKPIYKDIGKWESALESDEIDQVLKTGSDTLIKWRYL